MARSALTRAGAALVVALTVTPAPGAGRERDPLEGMHAVRLDAPAPVPDVAFRALDGRPARLGEFTGRPVVLTFFTTW